MQSHQQWKSVPLSPHCHQHLLSPECYFNHSDGVWLNLRVILICIFLMTKDIEHFFKCSWAIWDSLVENSLFSSVVLHFWVEWFGSLESNFLSSLHISDISPLSNVGLVNLFSQSVGCCFVLLIVSFDLQSFSILWGPICWLFILKHKPLVFCSESFPCA